MCTHKMFVALDWRSLLDPLVCTVFAMFFSSIHDVLNLVFSRIVIENGKWFDVFGINGASNTLHYSEKVRMNTSREIKYQK